MDKEELLDKYFERSLNKDEEAAFNQLKETDPEFAEELAFRLDVKQAFVLLERQKTKTFLQEVEKDLKARQPVKHRVLFGAPWYYAAASLTALLILAIYFLWSGSQQSSSSLPTDYLSYYAPYPNIITPVTRQGAATTGDSLELVFFAAYEKGDYLLADRAVEKLEKDLRAYLLFYHGIVKFELGAYREATALFEQYLQRKDLQFAPQAQWYAALACLANGNAEQSKPYLLALLAEKSFKVEEAKTLLGTLDK